MSSENGEVYIMSAVGDEEWVSPTPVQTAIREAVIDATALTDDEIDNIESYVEMEALRAVLAGEDDELTVTVEDHEVTVTSDDDITVE